MHFPKNIIVLFDLLYCTAHKHTQKRPKMDDLRRFWSVAGELEGGLKVGGSIGGNVDLNLH